MSEEQRGYKDGLEIGMTEGLALATTFVKLGKEAASIYRKKIDQRLAPYVIDGQIDAKAAGDMFEIALEQAFSCGAVVMFQNQKDNIQLYELLKEITIKQANR